jgi:tRNA pseudouridine55 synthase
MTTPSSPSGWLPINKPPGMSSFSVIRQFKRQTQWSGKVGHGGTLDVFASGVLILLIGSSTREFDQVQQFPKTYRAAIRLGMASTTLDIEGVLTLPENQTADRRWPLWDDWKAVLPQFLGEQEQVVPEYSAAKVNGQPRYALARQGKTVAATSKMINVYDIKIIAMSPGLLTLDITCSSGTYIRQLTADLTQIRQIPSFLYGLERRAIGPFTLSQCAQLEELTAENWTEHLLPSPVSAVSPADYDHS